ncbi:hypothetical protein C5O80_28475 [Burkholderia sp. SRS-46]|nr:hypothetical protein C5O80_28475 [Burkholderia sp. SRS-46]
MNGQVRILEYSNESLLVRWDERGRSGTEEQRWTLGRALRSGTCTLSGSKIVCGDAVFRPGDRPAARPNAMILAAELERIMRTIQASPQVYVLEYSDELLLVRWVEPGRAHYGEQHWRAGRAQRSGVCALSGSAIVRGDDIFRPTGRPMPSNARAMILAAALDRNVRSFM